MIAYTWMVQDIQCTGQRVDAKRLSWRLTYVGVPSPMQYHNIYTKRLAKEANSQAVDQSLCQYALRVELRIKNCQAHADSLI